MIENRKQISERFHHLLALVQESFKEEERTMNYFSWFGKHENLFLEMNEVSDKLIETLIKECDIFLERSNQNE